MIFWIEKKSKNTFINKNKIKSDVDLICICTLLSLFLYGSVLKGQIDFSPKNKIASFIPSFSTSHDDDSHKLRGFHKLSYTSRQFLSSSSSSSLFPTDNNLGLLLLLISQLYQRISQIRSIFVCSYLFHSDKSTSISHLRRFVLFFCQIGFTFVLFCSIC